MGASCSTKKNKCIGDCCSNGGNVIAQRINIGKLRGSSIEKESSTGLRAKRDNKRAKSQSAVNVEDALRSESSVKGCGGNARQLDTPSDSGTPRCDLHGDHDFKIGEEVEVTDMVQTGVTTEDELEWNAGFVMQLHPLLVRLPCNDEAHSWKQVRPLSQSRIEERIFRHDRDEKIRLAREAEAARLDEITAEASSKIQAARRGQLGRRDAEEKKTQVTQEKKGATAIQSARRAQLARREVEKKRKETPREGGGAAESAAEEDEAEGDTPSNGVRRSSMITKATSSLGGFKKRLSRGVRKGSQSSTDSFENTESRSEENQHHVVIKNTRSAAYRGDGRSHQATKDIGHYAESKMSD